MNEPMHDGLRDALRRLREDAAGQAAPAALEGQLVEAFRAHHRATRQHSKWVWMPAAGIAAALAVAFGVRVAEPVKVEKAEATVESRMAAPLPAAIEKPVTSAPAVPEKRKSPSRVRRPRVPSRPLSLASVKPRPEAVEDEPFVRIPYAPPFTPHDEGQILRVNMTGSSVRRMGIPVAAQQVQADLLVGNDGLPRAVRLVSHSSSRY